MRRFFLLPAALAILVFGGYGRNEGAGMQTAGGASAAAGKIDYWPMVGPLLAGSYAGDCMRLPQSEALRGAAITLDELGQRHVALAEAPPRIVSEACRAVDLLVSVSAVALEADAGKDLRERGRRLLLLADQAGMDAMRRRMIAQLLQAQIAAGRVRLEGFHVHAGGAQVSMRTGRVLRNGTPLELAPPAPAKRLSAVPWLPYDEALLERVIHSVGALLETGDGG